MIGTTLADGSKKKIRDLMHLLYEHAIRYEWTDRNPITSVRQSGVRQATPIRLGVDQLSQLIYGELKQRERVMVLLDFENRTAARRTERRPLGRHLLRQQGFDPKALNSETAHR
jgi:site-specific recombinase XerD